MPIIRPPAAHSALLPDEPLAPQRGRPDEADATLQALRKGLIMGRAVLVP